MVFKEQYSSWPARNGRPGGERWEILGLDMTQPPSDRFGDMLHYTLQPAEKESYWGKLQDKVITLAVVGMFSGDGPPSFRGRIVEVPKA